MTGSILEHARESCRPGRSPSGLRVVDASVLPTQVSGNSAAPVMAVGWIAGGIIAAGG